LHLYLIILYEYFLHALATAVSAGARCGLRWPPAAAILDEIAGNTIRAGETIEIQASETK
jgi:hypothetical protein